jgi:4-amino-4-deoxy-L-arabinose transferase-like glycosyltransferase
MRQRAAAVPPLAWLLLLTLGCLAPFLGKAFFTDDTLFLRAAEQIQKHPADFYGFRINWFGYTSPMTVAFDNPPLTSYYIALAASILGWSEFALHLAFLLPALAVAGGIFALAKQYCRHPFTAAVIAVLTPVFLISATPVMCDVMQLAFWVWSVVSFEKGLRSNRKLDFVFGGVLAGLAVMTKYLGLALVPLLLAYGVCQKRRAGWWLLTPLVPLLFALAYEWITGRIYGHGLLFSAAKYASNYRADTHQALWERALVGLSFLGGCFASVLFFSPVIWSRRLLLLMPCLMAACLLLIPRVSVDAKYLWRDDGSLDWPQFLYLAVLTVGGVYIFLLAAVDLWQRRDAISVLLLLWLAGMFIFTTAVNWTINGRSLLPALPAIAILAARRLDKKNPNAPRGNFMRILWPAIPSAAVSLLLVQADCNLANAHRLAARELGTQYHAQGRRVWFLEHSGFQYYAEQSGARALEEKTPGLAAGDVVILGYEAEDVTPVLGKQARLIESRKYFPNKHFSTFSFKAGAGFYATAVGPIPFAVKGLQPECFEVYEMTGSSPTELAADAGRR